MLKNSHSKRHRPTIWAIIAAVSSFSSSAEPAYADATYLIPPEYCGVVVASETSLPLLMASPNLSVYANHDFWVFGTNRGAFAAIIGITSTEGREEVLVELLENGVIMGDAFCSGGDRFWGLALEPPEGPIPIFGEVLHPQPSSAGVDLVIPPIRAVSPKEILGVQPIREGLLEEMIPQVERMRRIFYDHAISMGTGSPGNTVGLDMWSPYQCANLGRALGMTGSLGEGSSFQYLSPGDDPHAFLQISVELGVWMGTAESVVMMSQAQRISTWNLECVGSFGIPFSSYREDDPGQADMVAHGEFLNVLGEIDVGFYDRFRETLDQHPEVRIVSLGSGGGSVIDALQSGVLIRERGLSTQLYGKCYSACPMVFVGGVDRDIYWPSDSSLGFHQIYSSDGPEPMTSAIYYILRFFLEEMGVDADTFIGWMALAGPDDMHEPDVGDLCSPRIATWVQRLCHAENP